MGRRAAAWIIALAILAAACSGADDPAPVTTSPAGDGGTTVTTTLPPAPTTTEPLPEFPSVQEATAYLFSFDAQRGNPDALRLALEEGPGGHFPGLPLPDLVANGSPGVVAAVLEVLANPSPQNVQILIAMEVYGRPSGSLPAPDPWDPVSRIGIESALDAAAVGFYGELADVARAIIRDVLDSRLAACDPTCDWAGAWYDVPDVVTQVTGVLEEATFVGTVDISSGTGETTSHQMSLELVLGQWVITAGYLAAVEPPVLTILSPVNGAYVTDGLIAISGIAEAGTVVTAGGDRYEVDEFQFWDLVVEMQAGRNEVLVTATNPGGSVEEAISLTYVPDAEPRFGYLTAMDAATVTFDAAEFLTGPAADAAAFEAGEIGEGETVPNGFYIRDLESEPTPLPVAPAVTVILLDAEVTPVATEFSELRAMSAGTVDLSRWYGGNPTASPFNLLLVDGAVVQLEQQYLP